MYNTNYIQMKFGNGLVQPQQIRIVAQIIYRALAFVAT